MTKTYEEMLKEFFDNGGEIEVIETITPEDKRTIRSITKKVPELMTLPEAEALFGRKQVKKKKVKVPDFSDINIDLIPEHLRGIIKTATKEELLETDKNTRCDDASNKGKS